MIQKTTLAIQIFLMVLISSCATPATEVTSTNTPPPLTPTPVPTRTEVPTPTEIPGLEGWSVFNPSAVDIATENGAVILTLNRRALWFMEQRGVLIHQPVSGNFKITADVYTAKESDPSQPPGGDGSVQLSGLMARNGQGGLENYVFIVVGDDGNGLSVETKNTVDSFSKYDGPSWNSAEAELRICRFDSTFNLYKRVVGSEDEWTLAGSFNRPDLPDTLQVGVNIYTDNVPDLRARIENLQIEPISAEIDCEM